MKVVPKKRISSSFREQDLTEKTRREIQNWKTLDHQHILRIKYYFQDLKNFYIMSELCEGGSLVNEIVKENELPSERLIAHIMRSLFSVISYCHSRKIVHRDLKPENILLETDQPDAGIKIIDFGVSAIFNEEKPLKDRYGSSYYIAPEVINGEYNEKCDVWSAGVIAHILLSGLPPFSGRNDREIFAKVKTGRVTLANPIWEEVSQEAKDFVMKLLERDIPKRLSAAEALKDPWIQTYAGKKDLGNPLTQDALKNLKQFTRTSALQVATLTFIAHNVLTYEQEKGLKSAFEHIDKDSNGTLTVEEIRAGYSHLNELGQITEAEIEDIFNKIDSDKNGKIDYSEFVSHCIKTKEILTLGTLKKAFDLFDQDGNGTINATELTSIFSGNGTYTEEFWTHLISEVDKNSDGVLSFDEFKEMMLSGIAKDLK
mmetsp:Transcript_39403/g.44855  ORF Transcript_39403/g.44855 Transcript_39403/m.44855 type:complete len:429 (-) Transcript_39403:143-1429(-)